MSKKYYELKKLFSIKNDSSSITSSIKGYVKNDPESELFSGELVSQVLRAKENNLSSAYFMSFDSSQDQKPHFHTGSRILFIFTDKNARARLKKGSEDSVEEELEDNFLYILRMDKEVEHKFSGDFVAISIHPEDTSPGANMEDETKFVD